MGILFGKSKKIAEYENLPEDTRLAFMAAGGDLGASVAPQAIGIVVDNVAVTDWANTVGSALSLSPEQVGFKAGMLTATIFPALGVIILLCMKTFFKKSAIKA